MENNRNRNIGIGIGIDNNDVVSVYNYIPSRLPWGAEHLSNTMFCIYFGKFEEILLKLYEYNIYSIYNI